MASWGLLGGLGAGMSQVGQNMFEQAKLDRINEFRMQLQQEQNSHNSKESAKDRQHQADLQADQQRFTEEQAQLKAQNDLAVAQAEGVKPDWQKVELADGSVIFVDPNTGKQQFVSSNPIINSLSQGGLNLPGNQAQPTPQTKTANPTVQQTAEEEPQPATRRTNPRSNNSWYQNRN